MSDDVPPVGVLGGGGFGRGLARAASRVGCEVILWSRSRQTVDGERVTVTPEMPDVGRAELVFVAVPSPYVAEVARQAGMFLDGSHLLVHVSRGLVGTELRTLTHVLREQTPCRRVGVLAGPLNAEALAEGEPGGGVVGTRFPEVADAVRESIAGPRLRIYETEDLEGVEIASAMVGLMALGAGYARGLGVGPATLAVLVTRGMAEAARIGATLGAEERTFAGLAGVGDLIAAVADDGRPELKLGRALARGESLEEAGKRAGAHIEGVAIARQAASYAARLGIDAPISETMAALLEGRTTPADAIEDLMSRQIRSE